MNARKRMQQRQASLMQALSGSKSEIEVAMVDVDTCNPVAFDAVRLYITSEALKRKRHKGIARCWPVLMDSRCYDHDAEFANYVIVHPSAHPGGPIQDGAAFLEYLATRASLTPALEAELIRFRIQSQRKHNFIYRFASYLWSTIAWHT
jgi:hypothetical protein